MASIDVAIEDDNILDDSMEDFQHNFTLVYAINTLQEHTFFGPETTASFTFGSHKCFSLYFYIAFKIIFLVDKKYFQIQFGPIDFCVNWGVSH